MRIDFDSAGATWLCHRCGWSLVQPAAVDPEDGSVTPLVATKVPRHDHSTVTLLADGSVLTLGGNASDLANDPERTDAGVPVAQIYKPSYFFGGERPAIEKAPRSSSTATVSWSTSRTRARRRSARSCSTASVRSHITGTGATAT